jgi:hypothetical protein
VEQDADHPAPKPEHVIPELILASLNAVDQEIRPALLNNIVIVGAASQQKGLVKRFDNEIKALFPGPNVRLHTGSSTGERSFAAWIGGSILASLGSFHQVSLYAVFEVAVLMAAVVDLTEGVQRAWAEYHRQAEQVRTEVVY